MTTIVSRRSQRSIPRPGRKSSNTLYATAWAGITQAAPSSLSGSTATRFRSYTASSSSVAIADTGTKSFTVAAGGAHAANDYIFFVADSDPTKWMAGNVTSYNSGTGAISFNVTASNGAGTFSAWTVGGPIADGRNYFGNIKFVGADTDTGFALPSGAPFYATINAAFGIQVIDWYDGFPSNDAAGLAASAETTFEQVTINGVTTTALVIDQKAPTVPIDSIGYKKQTWAMLHRNVALAADLPRFLIKYDLWINDLAGKLTTTNRRVNFCEMKTTTDFRYVITIIMADATAATEFGVAIGTIGWEISADNKAGSLSAEEFFRFTTYDVPVPQEEFFNFMVYWVRATDYADEDTGRLLVQYKLQDAADYTTVCDYNAESNIGYNSAHPLAAIANTPDTDNRNIHMGVSGEVPERIFFFGVYGKYEQTNMMLKCANLEFHDNYLPPRLASSAVIFWILHGPQSYTPTVTTGIVKYVSPTGTGVGTFADPMSLSAANTSAVAGDHFWLRGGTYAIGTSGFSFTKHGTSGSYIVYESYPGETVIFDGSVARVEGVWQSIYLEGSFTRLRHVEVTGMARQGIEIDGVDNIVEYCDVHGNWLSGITIYSSENFSVTDTTKGSRNIVQHNTCHANSDVGHLTGWYADGGNADGISLYTGADNIIQYNLVYGNSDDGIDIWKSERTIVRYNIAYSNGLGGGDGTGIKCGGGSAVATGAVISYNISVGNVGKGFSGNGGDGVTVHHNTSSGNYAGFWDFTDTDTLVGNISDEVTRYGGGTAGHSGNSWDISVGTVPSFISIDPSNDDYYKPPAGNMFANIGAHAS